MDQAPTTRTLDEVHEHIAKLIQKANIEGNGEKVVDLQKIYQGVSEGSSQDELTAALRSANAT